MLTTFFSLIDKDNDRAISRTEFERALQPQSVNSWSTPLHQFIAVRMRVAARASAFLEHDGESCNQSMYSFVHKSPAWEG